VIIAMLGTASLAVIAALSGEFSDSIGRATDGPTSAYLTAAAAFGIGFLVMAVVIGRLLIGG
jgi:hypothetical protein